MNPINNNNILNFPEKDRELNTPEKTISTSTGSLLSGGEQSLNTSFVKLTEYSNNLRSRRSSHSPAPAPAPEKFTPGNNNQSLLNMKKDSPVSLRETFPQLATGGPEGETALPSGAPGWVGDIGHSRGENKNTPPSGAGSPFGGETTPSLITKGTKYLGGKDILTPVKSNTPERKDLSPWPGGFSGGASGSHTTDLDTLRRTPETKYFSRGESFSPAPEKFTPETEIATSQYLVYSFNNSKKKIIGNITSILKNSFYSMYSLISRPVLDITPNKITIHLFFFVSSGAGGSRRKTGKSSQYPTYPSGEKWGPPGENNGESSPREFSPLRGDFLNSPARSGDSGEENHKQLQILCTNLSRYLKKPVELELVRLYYPYNDSQILANTIGLLSKNIRNRFRSLVDNTFNFSQIKNPTKMITGSGSGEKKPRISILPSFLTGIKIRLGGRLLSQKVVPRFTVQTFQEGSLARTKANFVTSSRFTAKNKRGTFSITVSIGHGFF